MRDFGLLADELLVQAKELGICDKGLRQWDRDNVDNMIRLWVDNIDFGIKHDWPSLDVFDEVDKSKLAQWGVWVDHEFADGNWVLPYGGRMILNGTCTGVINLRGWQVATILVRHDCDVRIVTHDSARAQVRVYDTATVNARHEGLNKISLWPRSDKCTICTSTEENYHEYYGQWGE